MRSSYRRVYSINSGGWKDRKIMAYLDVHQVIHTCPSKLRELLATLLQERTNFISFLALCHIHPHRNTKPQPVEDTQKKRPSAPYHFFRDQKLTITLFRCPLPSQNE